MDTQQSASRMVDLLLTRYGEAETARILAALTKKTEWGSDGRRLQDAALTAMHAIASRPELKD